jgi:CRISPR-associated protein Cas2
MYAWLIYDITDNKNRNKVIKSAQKKGLHRVQKSVFLGTINKNKFDELKMECEEIIDEETDSVYLFPLCEKDFKAVVTIGQAFDDKLVTETVKALFF